MAKKPVPPYFEFFNEVSIIEQLSRSIFESLLPSGFLVSHFAVLNHLIRVEDGRTPLQLANAFQVPKTTMTHTLAILEKHALVRLKPNAKDGRSKKVWLTEAGKDFRGSAIEKMNVPIKRITGSISEDKIAQILPLLRDIRIFMDENRNGLVEPSDH